jgi:hypothetical protein
MLSSSAAKTCSVEADSGTVGEITAFIVPHDEPREERAASAGETAYLSLRVESWEAQLESALMKIA